MYLKSLYLLFFTLAIFYSSNAQTVTVDKFSGTGYVNVPLGEVKSLGVSNQIGLTFSSNSVSPSQPSGDIGTGWSLNVGGSISRMVQDLPDDFYDSNDSRYGWLYNPQQSLSISNFVVSGDGDFTDCSDEQADFDLLANISDAEPDMFYINAPGISGRFVLDNNGEFRTINHSNLKIDYSTNIESKLITSFTITNDQGTRYAFSKKERTIEQAVLDSADENTVDFYNRYYDQFKEPVTFHSRWFLTSITTLYDNSINYEYTSYEEDTVLTNLDFKVYGLNDANYVPISNMHKDSKVTSHYLKKIVGEFETVEFSYQNITYSPRRMERKLSEVRFTSSLTGELIQKHTFSYMATADDFFLFSGAFSGYQEIHRTFLHKIYSERNCSSADPVEFNYYGLKNVVGEIELPQNDTTYYYHSPLRFSTINAGDSWGNLNSKNTNLQYTKTYYDKISKAYKPQKTTTGNFVLLNGGDGQVDEEYQKVGLIKHIKTPLGGMHSIYYESNSYFDNDLNRNVKGAGARVKETIYHDGRSHANDIRKEYEYADGNLLFQNEKAFQVSYVRTDLNSNSLRVASDYEVDSDEQVRRMTLRSVHGLNSNLAGFPLVGYENVTEYLSGKGKVQYNFNVPENYFTSSKPSSYIATQDYTSLGKCAYTSNILYGQYVYPYAPVENRYDVGVVNNIYEFNELGQKVREKNYLYSSAPNTTIKAISLGVMHEYNKVDNSKYKYLIFSPYTVRTGGAFQLDEIVTTTFSSDLSTSAVESKEFFRESANHRYITRDLTNYQDGSSSTKYYKYIVDFDPSSDSSDPMIIALKDMKNKHQLSIPIETYAIRSDDGSSVVEGASLNLYKSENGLTQISKYLGLNKTKPSFVGATINGSGASQSLVFDDDYEPVKEIVSHNSNGLPTGEVNPRINEKSGTIYGFDGKIPIMSVLYVHPEEVLFSDFEYNSDQSFELSSNFDSTLHIVPGKIGKRGVLLEKINLIGEWNLRGDIVKNANEYSLSLHLKSSLTGQLSISLSGNSTNSIQTLNFSNTNANWNKIESLLDFSVFANDEEITVTVSTNEDVEVDHMLLIPTDARYTYSLIDPLNGLLEVYNNEGLVSKQEYTDDGRLSRVYNHLGEIIKYYEYPITEELHARFVSPTTILDLEEVAFDASTCASATFTWQITDLSDQSSQQFTGRSISYTFPKPGYFEIDLTAVDNVSSDESTVILEVLPHPILVDACMAGPSRIDVCQAQADAWLTCNEIGTVPHAKTDPTHFKVTFVDSNILPITYQWQFRTTDNPNNGWGDVGGNSDSYLINYINGASYEVRCIVTDAEGHEGITEPMQVEVFESSLGCTL